MNLITRDHFHLSKAAKRFMAPMLVVGGLTALAAGCGTVSATSPTPSLPSTPPTAAVLQRLVPQSHTIVKTEMLSFKGQAPEDIVVSTLPPAHKSSIVEGLRVSLVSWDSHSHHWTVSWKSAPLALQQQFLPGGSKLPAVSSWKVVQNNQGALIGVLDPASIGADTLWNDGFLMWIAPHKNPKILWTAKGRHQVADGVLAATIHGILLSQEACGAVEAVNENGHGTVKNLSCTTLISRTPGRRLAFVTEPGGRQVHLSERTLAVSEGSTLVFWPSNASTAKLVNNGQLGLYGGDTQGAPVPGQIPLDLVDTLSHWSYQFKTPGTYEFAIVPDSTSSLSIPAAVTVTVTG